MNEYDLDTLIAHRRTVLATAQAMVERANNPANQAHLRRQETLLEALEDLKALKP